MGLISAIHSELIKTKHTPFLAIHVAVPLAGTFLFMVYNFLYAGVADLKRFQLILELTATMYPLLISSIVGLNILKEEKPSHFQALLAAPSRSRIFLAKLTTLYGAGLISLVSMFCLLGLGTALWKLTGGIPFSIYGKAVIGLGFSSLILYLFHLFLSLKFGLGISLLWGVVESLQCILYSNIQLRGVWRYIPFAWSMNWIHDTLNGDLTAYAGQWITISILTVCILLLTLNWFSHWEGRKSYE